MELLPVSKVVGVIALFQLTLVSLRCNFTLWFHLSGVKFHQCGLEFVHNVRNCFFSGFKFKARNDTKSKQKRCKWKLSLVNYYVEINTVTKPFHSLFVLLWCIFIQTLKPFTVIVICMFRSSCNVHAHVYRWCTFTCTCTVQVHCIYLRFNCM